MGVESHRVMRSRSQVWMMNFREQGFPVGQQKGAAAGQDGEEQVGGQEAKLGMADPAIGFTDRGALHDPIPAVVADALGQHHALGFAGGA